MNDLDSPQAPAAASSTLLTKLISIDTLQRIQDRFAALGQVSACVCTVEGRLITRPTWGSRFSELIGTCARGREALAASLQELARDIDPAVAVMTLHGMTLYAAPIGYQNRRLALIVVGTRPAIWPPLETIQAAAADYEIDCDELLGATQLVKANVGGTPEDAHQFADVLAETIATLYGQAERIERQLADLRTVHGLAELLSGTRDLQEILDLTVRRVVQVMPVKACGIRLLDERTGELVIKAVCNLSPEYLQKGPVMLAESPIDGAAFAGYAIYIEDAPHDPRIRYPENARREGIVSGLCVPMTYRGKTIGVVRVYTARRYRFTDSEESLLRSIGSQAASAIISSRLSDERAEAERVQRQIEAAGQIQRRMLPSRLPQHSGLTFGCVYGPTLEVGGDFYDFVELSSGGLGVSVADVVGKGLPAALMMASVRAALRAHARTHDHVEDVVARVNEHLCRDTQVGEFTTLVYGVFAKDGQSLTYCNAGHVPPLLLRGDEFCDLTAGGPVIGLQPTTFDVETVAIRPGDVLVLTTDGITEAMGFEGAGYGRQRLMSSVKKHRNLDAPQLAQQLLWDVRRFVGLADQSDDITIVVVKAV